MAECWFCAKVTLHWQVYILAERVECALAHLLYHLERAAAVGGRASIHTLPASHLFSIYASVEFNVWHKV
jgi:hypothetical protein